MKKLAHLLYQDDNRLFTPPPMVSYRSARKPSSYLVRAYVYPLEKKRCSSKCDNFRCLVCNNIRETDTFMNTVTGESFKINHNFAVIINALFTFWPAKCVRNNIQKKRLIDLDYDRTTLKKAIWNSQRVKRLNKNLCTRTFLVIVIKALKKMFTSV